LGLNIINSNEKIKNKLLRLFKRISRKYRIEEFIKELENLNKYQIESFLDKNYIEEKNLEEIMIELYKKDLLYVKIKNILIGSLIYFKSKEDTNIPDFLKFLIKNESIMQSFNEEEISTLILLSQNRLTNKEITSINSICPDFKLINISLLISQQDVGSIKEKIINKFNISYDKIISLGKSFFFKIRTNRGKINQINKLK